MTITCGAQYPPVAANTCSLEALVKIAQNIDKASVDA